MKTKMLYKSEAGFTLIEIILAIVVMIVVVVLYSWLSKPDDVQKNTVQSQTVQSQTVQSQTVQSQTVQSNTYTSPTPTVNVKSVALKLILSVGSEALRIASENYLGVSFDSKALLALIAPPEPKSGLPPSDYPVLIVANKNTNEIKYWQLTDRVKMIRLKHENPGPIELKVLNEKPLRIELWIQGDIKELDLIVELKE